MGDFITWLHLSDLHACNPLHGWDANRVTRTLCDDLRRLQHEQNLRPDLIFFTGDAAFGHLGDEPGQSIQSQFRVAHDFLTAVRQAFSPELGLRDVYLVPGNHDVNRYFIDEAQTDWLRANGRSLDQVLAMLRANKAQWRRYRERLDDYYTFLRDYEYGHLLTDPSRLYFADTREVADIRVGIAGLNSAWSCFGGDDDKAKLWMCGHYQIEQTLAQLDKSGARIRIALIHHPGNWFVASEDPDVKRSLERDFQFILHGHEHQGWVDTNADTGHVVLSGGACYDRSDRPNGYSVTRLEHRAGTGEVWLRQYDRTGGGWVAREIASRAPRGVWSLGELRWLRPKTQGDGTGGEGAPPLKGSACPEVAVAADPAEDYERRYRESVVQKHDYVELFGIDIPREAQQHSLSVAYVSLNLAGEAEDEESEVPEQEPSDGEEDTTDSQRDFAGSLPVDAVFARLRPGSGRLLIRGVAGSGKSTLLRWAAIQAARATGRDGPPTRRGLQDRGDWLGHIPFLIRLRDFTDGRLPRPQDFPAVVAKELPDPPAGWMTKILDDGQAFILLDGLDEVPATARVTLARELKAIADAYPRNYYVLTTRPEAVEPGSLDGLGFFVAQVEAMTEPDREMFIDRWFVAVEAQSRTLRRHPENFAALASDLKKELQDTPAVARLGTLPLLCAAICALYRQRNKKLPETPAELCEDLCKMLLHRRERETPDLQQHHLPPAYRALTYDEKKFLLAELARHMVEQGVSSLGEADADARIAEALQQFPNHASASGMEVRHGLVERSGLLRPSGLDRIDFLHNTLKEYLAAERFVKMDNVQLLAAKAIDPAWQPVVLFAAALDRTDFAGRLLRQLLEELNRGGWTRSKRTAREFFIVRCRNAAFRLDPDLVQQANEIARRLLPPKSVYHAEMLAECGDSIVPHLSPRPELTEHQKAASIRALRVIATPRAAEYLKRYAGERGRKVLRELVVAASVLGCTLPEFCGVEDLNLTNAGRIRDLTPLARFPDLRWLRLRYLPMQDLSPLMGLVKLAQLDLANTRVRDLSPLTSLRNLSDLDLSHTYLGDLAPLLELIRLAELNLLDAGLTRIPPMDRLASLRILNLGRNHYFTDLSPLAGLTQLEDLRLYGTQVADLSPLTTLSSLQTLWLDGTLVTDLSPISSLTSLEFLSFSETGVANAFPLMHLHNLQRLWLDGTAVSDVSPLAGLIRLRDVSLENTSVTDISPLAGMPALETLDLSRSGVSDIRPLMQLKRLKRLRLAGAAIPAEQVHELKRGLSGCRID
jgi:Leucine-rich repeat (LRR) protein/predicted MPP superfamily phosphohydrolase